MFNYSEQLNESFEELMRELRAMRRELGRIRANLEQKPQSAHATVRTPRTRSPRAGSAA